MQASEAGWRLVSPQCECSLGAQAARVMGLWVHTSHMITSDNSEGGKYKNASSIVCYKQTSEAGWRLVSPQCECSLGARAARVMGRWVNTSHMITSGSSECRKCNVRVSSIVRYMQAGWRLEAIEFQPVWMQPGNTSCASDGLMG